MSNPSSPTLNEVVENIVEEVLRERVKQQENQETAPKEVREEHEEEIEVEAGDARAFYSDKGAEAYKKYLKKKGLVEESGIKKIVAPFKEEIERRG